MAMGWLRESQEEPTPAAGAQRAIQEHWNCGYAGDVPQWRIRGYTEDNYIQDT